MYVASTSTPNQRRTYGSNRRPTSSLRGSAAPPSKGGRFRGTQTAGPAASAGGAEAGGGGLMSGGGGLPSTFEGEEEAKSPPPRDSMSMSSRLSPGFDSSPIELAFS